MILDSFTHSDMNFQTILMPKVILAKFLSQEINHLDHSYLNYALDHKITNPFKKYDDVSSQKNPFFMLKIEAYSLAKKCRRKHQR